MKFFALATIVQYLALTAIASPLALPTDQVTEVDAVTLSAQL
jgi:hypothetical protein